MSSESQLSFFIQINKINQIGGTQRRALPRHQSEEIKINIEWGSNP